MRHLSRVSMIFIATTGIITVLSLAFVSYAGQARGPAPAQPAQTAPRGQAAPAAAATRSPAGIPRMPDGKPNFTGLWQSMVTADWDIQDHIAQAGSYYQLGAIGTIPPGQGIVDGNEIPYKPEALAQKKTNHDNWLTMDPVVKCYMPGVPRA